jgi:hypothetical protein
MNAMQTKKTYEANRERILQSLASGLSPRDIFRSLKADSLPVYYTSFWSYLKSEELFSPYLPKK